MLPQRPRAVALAAALALALTACGEAGDVDGAAPPATSQSTSAPTEDDGSRSTAPTQEDSVKPSPIPIPEPSSTALPTGPVPEAVAQRPDVRAAIEDHAKRVGVEPSEVTVEGFAEVTWSDGSIGCPQPGMMYTQALVPGLQLVLGVDGKLASYHAANGKPFSYCASPVPPAETSATS